MNQTITMSTVMNRDLDISPNIICRTKSDLTSSLCNCIAISNLFPGLGSELINEWNSLPNHTRESNGIAAFKKNVLNLLRIITFIFIYLYVLFLRLN